MADGCTSRNRVYVADRGGEVIIGEIPAVNIDWRRTRDDISNCRVRSQALDLECRQLLKNTEPVRHELQVWRGQNRVWEGPITWMADETTGQVTIEAHDVAQWTAWAVYFSGYNDRYPNCKFVTDRTRIMLNQQLARFEALTPPINVLPWLNIIHSGDGPRECRELLEHEKTVWEELDSFARDSGVDYTVIGRSIAVVDTHDALGWTMTATEQDFLGPLVVTSYGMEFATFVSATDGQGHYGWAGGGDPYYGRVEKLYTLRQEGESTESNEPPSRQALMDAAERQLEGRNPVPTLVRVPANSTVNPNSEVLNINNLVPCARIPVRADLTLQTVNQVMKLDEVVVTEDESGEQIQVTMSQAPEDQAFPEGNDLTSPVGG